MKPTQNTGSNRPSDADPIRIEATEKAIEKPTRGRSRKRTAKKQETKPDMNPDRKPVSDKNGSGKRIALTAAFVFLCIIVASAAAYLYLSRQYRTIFFPNTVINGLDASGKNVEQVKEMIQSGMEGYSLTLETRDGKREEIAGADINLHSEYDGTLEQLLAAQNPLRWGLHYQKGTSHTISTMIAFDMGRLEQMLKELECLDGSKVQAPVDAYLSAYIEGTGYQIVPEDAGNRLIYDKVLAGAVDAIRNLQPVLSLEEIDAYEQPEITSENPELQARAEAWNRYVGVTVTYQFGDNTEVLDGDIIHTWLSEGAYGNVILNEEAVAAYVKTLADAHNTAYKAKTLKTSYGPAVTITRGNYGWRINQSAETAALSEIIRSGTGQTREPIYSQTAASHGEQDYGDTYVEINLTAQHLYFYKNGSLLVESDFVSGNESRGWSTPDGAYPLTYKQRDATLKGEGYATPVSYWMPFNGGIGMHDAGWRSGFGGTLYKTGGSHGCINLPPLVAKIIYENISAGMPVLCYHLEGTERGSASTAPGKTPAETSVPAEATAPAETTVPAEGLVPAETNANMQETSAEIPADTPSAPSVPAETAAEPVESSVSRPEPPADPTEGTMPQSTENYGSGGAPVKPDTGAVAGPGM